MKIVYPDKVFSTHSRFNKPCVTVESGEIFCVHTELNSGRWLQSLEDTYAPYKSEGSNLSVCIAVGGAEPGDTIAVHLLDITPGELGYTGFDTNRNMGLPALICRRDWGLVTKTVAIKDGYVLWSDDLKLPVSPMIGTLGTAPAAEEFRNGWGGYYGGNMDVQEVAAGTTIYLPVNVPEALLHIGDAHAIQGDGEINYGGGIECRAKVFLSVDVIKGRPQRPCVRLETDEYIMAVCCTRSIEEAFYTAAGEILEWMISDYCFTHEEAYLLMGQVLEARATQFVNPTRTYICKMPKQYLTPSDQ